MSYPEVEQLVRDSVDRFGMNYTAFPFIQHLQQTADAIQQFHPREAAARVRLAKALQQAAEIG